MSKTCHIDQLSLDSSFLNTLSIVVDCKNWGHRVQVWRAEDNFVRLGPSSHF